MKVWQQRTLVILLMVVAGCDTGTGPNSLYKFQPATGCTACHSSAVSPSLDPLVTNGSGTAGKHVPHVQGRNIPCERCHNGYSPAATHMNGMFDTPNPAVMLVLFDSTNPTGTWTNDTGPGTGTCASVTCHGGASLDWYGTGLPACAACHNVQQGARRPVTGTSGDFASNPSISSHHISGASDPSPEQCQVCHEMSQHMSGTVWLKEADTGAAIVYSSSSPSTLEPFCLSCHDADGSQASFVSGGTSTSPFNDGSTLGAVPNEAGNKIAAYWNAAYTVHRSNGLTCAGTGAPGTGCHGNTEHVNMHGSTSKGLLTRNMTLPIYAVSPYDYDQFKLCFDCHESYPAVAKEVVLGYKQGGNYDVWWAPSPYSTPTMSIRSLFRDRYIGLPASYPPYWNSNDQVYNDNFWGDPFTPLHNYHLSPIDSAMQNVWDYRRSGDVGRATCITCHNVHGTNSAVRSTYDELGLGRGIGVGTDAFVIFGGYNVLQTGPINCAMECHSINGTSYYWYTPANE
jgi:predicted CxxxxCH...CXXCH cytochrome family protein